MNFSATKFYSALQKHFSIISVKIKNVFVRKFVENVEKNEKKKNCN
jgi:hypothetical protein